MRDCEVCPGWQNGGGGFGPAGAAARTARGGARVAPGVSIASKFASRARIEGARTWRGWRTPADAPACPPRRDLSPRIPRSWPWWRCSTPPRGGGPGSWPPPSPWRRAPSHAARTATSSRMDGRARASFTVTPPRRVCARSGSTEARRSRKRRKSSREIRASRTVNRRSISPHKNADGNRATGVR